MHEANKVAEKKIELCNSGHNCRAAGNVDVICCISWRFSLCEFPCATSALGFPVAPPQILPPLESETRSADRIAFDKLWDLMCEKLGRQAQAGA
jgi:hypothetical protein